MKTLRIDFDKVIGEVKPFHAINNAPIMGTDVSLFHYLKEARIPYARLHDTGGEYGGFRFVDIENIFRDLDADPENPDSYDFAFTDWLLQELVKQGVKPFYRLGATIENDHRIKAYRIFPPKDNLKWAKICEGIIKHYNHGWANGFYMDIEYWEIWNEPDNEPDISNNPMWKGTKEQYFKLYEVAANYLKEKFSYIKIGGYSSCGFYALHNGGYVEAAKSSPRTAYFIEFFHEFLEYISSTEHKAPLDFFSWHSYDTCERNCKSAFYVRENLDKYGFLNTEIILNEWNPGIKRRGSEADACFISEMMCRMHNTPVDMLMYYDGQVHGNYQGFFNPLNKEIFPAIYACHSYGEIYDLGKQVYMECDKDLAVIAATNGHIEKILISNPSLEELPIIINLGDGRRINKYRELDGTNGIIEKEMKDGIVIPPYKIVILEVEKDD